MKTAKLQVLITAKDNATQSLSRMGGSFNKFRSTLGTAFKAIGIGIAAASAAFYGAIRIGKSLIDEYSKQETAIARLSGALKNVKGMTDKNVQALTKYASQLQRVTTFGDEQIISGMGMLSTFQMNEQQIRSLTPRMLDMAASLEKTTGEQVELEDVAKAVGKAMTGTAGALKRYGVSLTDAQMEAYNASTGQKRLALLTEILDQNFQGVAKTLAQTTTGKMRQLENAVSDVKEAMGETIARAISPFITKLTRFAQDPSVTNKIQQITSNLLKLGKTVLSLIPGFATTGSSAKSSLDKINFAIILIDESIKTFKKAIKAIGTFIGNIMAAPIVIFYKFRDAIESVRLKLVLVRQQIEKLVQKARGLPGMGVLSRLGFQQGTPYVPATGWYKLHEGEAVIPANRNGTGFGGLTVNILGGSYLSREAAEQMGDLIINKLRKNIKLSAIL